MLSIRLAIVGGIFLAILDPSNLSAKRYELSPNDPWFTVLSGERLKPGDEVVLSPGVYSDRRRLVMSHRGTADAPIMIRGSAEDAAIIHRPDARQNSINMVGAQHVTLREIEITGGSTGIRLMKSDRFACKFITIEQMHIHHVGGPAVTANSPGNAYEGLIFRGNNIHHTSGHGEGFYLGSNNAPDGSTTGYIFNSVVEQNYIHDLNGSDISQGDGIEIKDGSYNNIVRDNVIHDTNYPGIIVYGTDGRSPNIVERNAIWNSGDHGIQAAADAVVRNNVIINSRADGIHSHKHQSAAVGNLRILHNTIIGSRAESSGVWISLSEDAQLAGSLVIANNAIYVHPGDCAIHVPRLEAAMTITGNVGAGSVEGFPSRVAERVWSSAGRLDRDLDAAYYPLLQSALIKAGDPQFVVEDDFNGTSRGTSRDVGAYVFDERGNPGWKIRSGHKLPRR